MSFPDLGWLFYVVNLWLELTRLVIITDIGWLFLFIPDIGLLSKDYPCQSEFDGNVVIEAWKYPPVAKMGETPQWVDKLSLAISLRDDDDPRVEGEVERLLNEMKWKV